MTQQTIRRQGFLFFCPLLFISLLLAQVLVGCGQASQIRVDTGSGAPVVSTEQATRPPASRPGNTPTTLPSQEPGTPTTPTTQPGATLLVLHGPTNFLLNLPFDFASAHGVTTDTSGATAPLNAATIKENVTQELHHLLFVVDSSNAIKVYSQGAAPLAVQLTYNNDGSANLSYTHTADSEAGTVTILFVGLVTRKQISVQYEQQYTPSMLINAQASDIVVAFTAPVRWVASREIPAAPSNGAHQLTSQGGVALTWSAGQHAASYEVYRLISDLSQQFQLLATVRSISYIDNSSAVIQNIHATKGITYAIFSVGPTGVENPGGIVISL